MQLPSRRRRSSLSGNPERLQEHKHRASSLVYLLDVRRRYASWTREIEAAARGRSKPFVAVWISRAGLFTQRSVKEVKYLWCERQSVCAKKQMSSVRANPRWDTHTRTSWLFLPCFLPSSSSQNNIDIHNTVHLWTHARSKTHAYTWRAAHTHACLCNISLFPLVDLVALRYAHRLNWFPRPSVLVAKQTPVWSQSVCVHAALCDCCSLREFCGSHDCTWLLGAADRRQGGVVHATENPE